MRLQIRIAVIVMSWIAVAAPAASPVVLDDELRAHLGGLEAITSVPLDEELRRGQVVVVSFFASWCPPCRVEFHEMNALVEAFTNSPLTVIAVNVYEAFDADDSTRMTRFLADTDPRFHVVKGSDETIARFGGVDRIPTVLVFDGDGQRVLNFVHRRGATKMSVDAGELRAAVVRALSDTRPRP